MQLTTSVDQGSIALLPLGLGFEIVGKGFEAHLVLLLGEAHVLGSLVERDLAETILCLRLVVEVVALCPFKLQLLVDVLLFHLGDLIGCFSRTNLVGRASEEVEWHLHHYTHRGRSVVNELLTRQFAAVGVEVSGADRHIGQVVALGELDILTCQFGLVVENYLFRTHTLLSRKRCLGRCLRLHYPNLTGQRESDDVTEIHQCQLIIVVGLLNGEFGFVLFHLHLHDVVACAHAVTERSFHILLQFVKQSLVSTCHLTHFFGFHGEIVGLMGLHNDFRLRQTDILCGHIDAQLGHLVGSGNLATRINRLHH